MLSKTGKQIRPEISKPKQYSGPGKPSAAISDHPVRISFSEAIAEVKRQWKATCQNGLPVLRALK